MQLVLIYTDFIATQLLGDINSRYLRIIPVKNLYKGPQHIQFNTIQYVNIEKKFLQTISILLCSTNGEKIKFNESTTPTYLLLHFKKVR